MKRLSAINPRLIYCAISGFGMTGPLRDRPSFDIVLQAMSGALSVNGEARRAPTKLGIPLGDLVGGINGPIGILAALYERSVTGRGRLIDVSLLDGHDRHARLSGAIGVFHRGRSEAAGIGASQSGSVRDISGAGRIDHHRLPDEQLLGAHLPGVGNAGSAISDPRFDTIQKRRDNRRLVNERISEFTRQKTGAELVELFTQHEVPHAPILGIKEALSQPQAVAREMVVETDHQVLGKIPIVNRAIKFPGRSAAGSDCASGPWTAHG